MCTLLGRFLGSIEKSATAEYSFNHKFISKFPNRFLHLYLFLLVSTSSNSVSSVLSESSQSA